MHLSVTTPRGALVQTEVEEIAAPGALGEFGVLPGHLPFMSVLKPGVFAYKTKEGLRYLAVGDGILQVARTESGDKILALVDRGENAKDIDRDAVSHELTALDGELARTKAETAAEVKVLLGKRAWAAARVDAANRASNH